MRGKIQTQSASLNFSLTAGRSVRGIVSLSTYPPDRIIIKERIVLRSTNLFFSFQSAHDNLSCSVKETFHLKIFALNQSKPQQPTHLPALLHDEGHLERPLGVEEQGELLAPLLLQTSLNHLVKPAAQIRHQAGHPLARDGLENGFHRFENFLLRPLPPGVLIPVC